jgi:hypothetical protein
MATTTNYGWETADDTDLVKDGALAMRTLGSAIDTTTKALNPSTTLGDIEYRSATANTNTRLGIGSSGNVLTVTGGVPTWAAPAGGGGMTLLSTTTCSTGTTTVSTINSSYTDLQVVIYGLNLSTAASVNFNVNGSGSGIYATGIRAGNSSGGTAAAFTNTTNTGFQINQGQLIAGGNTSNAWKININNYSSTAIRKNITLVGGFDAGSEIMKYTEGGYWNSTSAISSFTLTTSTGTFSGGTILVYGVK